jgi:hypothetical protein
MIGQWFDIRIVVLGIGNARQSAQLELSWRGIIVGRESVVEVAEQLRLIQRHVLFAFAFVRPAVELRVREIVGLIEQVRVVRHVEEASKVSIDDFRPDTDLAVHVTESGGEPGELVVTRTVQRCPVDASLVRAQPLDAGWRLLATARPCVPYTARANDRDILRIPLSIAQRLDARADDADASVDELVSEWVTAEAAADNTISRDEILALLARHHPRSA